MQKYDMKGYKKKKRPIAKLAPGENILGGDQRHINPKRKLEKQQPSLLKRIFG